MTVPFILHVTIRKRFTLLPTIEGINGGLFRMFATPCSIFWIIFTSDLVISYTDKLFVLLGTNCAPLVADLFLFCHERDFMTSLSDENQADIIEAFN